MAFDLDSDGVDELIMHHYRGNDPALMLIDGATGAVLLEDPRFIHNNRDGAITIADVNGDGAAEIVFSNNGGFSPDTVQIYGGLPGQPFAPARRIRNQTVYTTATRVNEDGSVPVYPRPHWLIPGNNKFYGAPVVAGDDEGTVDRFRYRANDGALASNEATVELVLSQVNAPAIVSTPVTGASPGFAYEYGALATDADAGTTFTWTLADAPAGMTVSTLGIVRWQPTEADLGTVRVHLVVTDSSGHADEQSFAITVTPPVTVPALVGAPEDDVAALLADASLAGLVSRAYSDSVPAGEVISQSVASGDDAAAGSTIRYVVSLGPQPRFVPQLEGLNEALAQTLLLDEALDVGTVSYVNNPAARGTVLAQGTPANRLVEPGTAVDFLVSGGPALVLELGAELLAPGESVAVTVRSFDERGTPIATPDDLTLTIEAALDAEATVPVVLDGAVQAAAGSRGRYELVAASATLAASVRGELLVAEVFQAGSLHDSFAAFSAVLSETTTQLERLARALAEGDLVTVAEAADALENAPCAH